jgi:hypothetical protein
MGIRPSVLFIGTLLLLWLGMVLGSWLRAKHPQLAEEESTLTTLQGSVLALLGLLLGFTFSMAVSRYELRRQLAVSEANAIGTTWLRTATLPEPTRTQEQQLLRQYVPVRLQFLGSGHSIKEYQDSLTKTSALQARIWAVASSYASSNPNVIMSLFLSTLNESIDLSEERTAAFENRIPLTAWVLLLFMSFIASVLVGTTTDARSKSLQLVLPFVLAAALSLVLDLDSPRYGFIRMQQPSMERLAQLISTSLPQDQ